MNTIIQDKNLKKTCHACGNTQTKNTNLCKFVKKNSLRQKDFLFSMEQASRF